MLRINKNLAIFSSLIFLLGVSSAVSLQKLSPLIAHTAYYCQSFINSLSLPIPYYLGAIPFIFFSVLLLIATLKLSLLCIKVQFLRKKLIANKQSNTTFNKLLEKLNLADKTYLIESEKQFAFCLGVRHPKIYVSTGLLDGLTLQETEAVLYHERYHLRSRDTLIMLIASIGQSLLPFFPLISDFLRNYRIEREIKADAEAIQRQASKKPLISVLKKLLATPSAAMVTHAAIADHDTLEPRIRVLISKDFHFRTFQIKHVFISLASVFIMTIVTLAPVQAVEIHHMGKDVMMICPQNDACLASCIKEYSINRKNYSENVPYTPAK